MNTTNQLLIKSELMFQLNESGIANDPGAAIYSGDETLKKGTYLFFGLNPGGVANETATVQQHFSRKTDRFNEYCDGEWAPGGNKKPRGGAILQRRAQYLFGSLVGNPRHVCAANLVFVRSRNVKGLSEGFRNLANQCWPFHRKLFEIVDPEVVLLMGNESFDFILSKISDPSNITFVPSGHGNWMCKAATGELEGKRRHVICMPHLSYYAINSHREVVAWIKSLTSGPLN